MGTVVCGNEAWLKYNIPNCSEEIGKSQGKKSQRLPNRYEWTHKLSDAKWRADMQDCFRDLGIFVKGSSSNTRISKAFILKENQKNIKYLEGAIEKITRKNGKQNINGLDVFHSRYKLDNSRLDFFDAIESDRIKCKQDKILRRLNVRENFMDIAAYHFHNTGVTKGSTDNIKLNAGQFSIPSEESFHYQPNVNPNCFPPPIEENGFLQYCELDIASNEICTAKDDDGSGNLEEMTSISVSVPKSVEKQSEMPNRDLLELTQMCASHALEPLPESDSPILIDNLRIAEEKTPVKKRKVRSRKTKTKKHVANKENGSMKHIRRKMKKCRLLDESKVLTDEINKFKSVEIGLPSILDDTVLELPSFGSAYPGIYESYNHGIKKEPFYFEDKKQILKQESAFKNKELFFIPNQTVPNTPQQLFDETCHSSKKKQFSPSDFLIPPEMQSVCRRKLEFENISKNPHSNGNPDVEFVLDISEPCLCSDTHFSGELYGEINTVESRKLSPDKLSSPLSKYCGDMSPIYQQKKCYSEAPANMATSAENEHFNITIKSEKRSPNYRGNSFPYFDLLGNENIIEIPHDESLSENKSMDLPHIVPDLHQPFVTDNVKVEIIDEAYFIPWFDMGRYRNAVLSTSEHQSVLDMDTEDENVLNAELELIFSRDDPDNCSGPFDL